MKRPCRKAQANKTGKPQQQLWTNHVNKRMVLLRKPKQRIRAHYTIVRVFHRHNSDSYKRVKCSFHPVYVKRRTMIYIVNCFIQNKLQNKKHTKIKSLFVFRTSEKRRDPEKIVLQSILSQNPSTPQFQQYITNKHISPSAPPSPSALSLNKSPNSLLPIVPLY